MLRVSTVYGRFAVSDHSEQPSERKVKTKSQSAKVDKVKLPVVLVVDDDEDSLFLLNHLLEQYACEVVSVSDGSEALAQVRSLQPDLILLDIWLPNMSGIDILRQIRIERLCPSTPVVAVTALVLEKDRELIFRSGFDRYICKPYDVVEMETLLNDYLVAT